MEETEENQPVQMEVCDGKVDKFINGPDQRQLVLHPLLMDLVLKEIFSYCTTLKQASSYRLVCQTWRNACQAQWRSFQTLTVFQFPLELEQDDQRRPNWTTLRELSLLVQNAQRPLEIELPYRKFKMQCWRFTPEVIETLSNAQHNAGSLSTGTLLQNEHMFWTTVALKLVTKLTVFKCKFFAQLVVFQEAFLCNFPNLKKFSVRDIELDERAAQLVKQAIEVEQRQQARQRRNQRQEQNIPLVNLEEDDVANEIEVALVPSPVYQHQNLRSVTVQAWNRVGQEFPQWSPFLKHLPKLEFLRIRASDQMEGLDWLGFLRSFVCIDWKNVGAGIKHLDMLDFSTQAHSYGVLKCENNASVNLPNLECFKYDLGLASWSVKWDIQTICRMMKNLKKLCLYHVPLDKPLQDLGTNDRLASLQELHLWGILCSTMQFLKALPNLEVLVWTSSAYDEQHNGQRLFQVWNRKNVFPLCNVDFVEATSDLPLMLKMTRLEIDWEPKSSASWKKLRQSMPLLNTLKVKVTNHEQLLRISEQWKALECLELAHGSVVNGTELIEALTEFENLKKFVWKGCLCTKEQLKEETIQDLVEYENILKSQLPSILEFPWQVFDIVVENENSTVTSDSGKEKMCIRGKYEKALYTRNTLVYTQN